MNFTCQLQPVPLSTINLADRSYCLVPWEEPLPTKELLASIRKFGILHPPILQQSKNDSYTIVAGRKRIIAAQHLAPDSSVFCRIVSIDTPQKAVFTLIIESASRETQLSIVEQIILFEKLLRSVSKEEALPMLEQLGYKPQKHLLDDMLKLRSLTNPALRAIHEGIIPVKNARKLLRLSETDQEMVVQHITALHFGGSKQQKLIDLSSELIMRKKMPLKKILAEFSPGDARVQSQNIPQQGAALLSWLHNECFPQMSEAENSFNRKVARLNLPPTMHIEHTPGFEDEQKTLCLRFPDWNSLENTVGEIKMLMDKK